MERQRIAAICASSILAVGIAFMAHESAHVLAGRIAGGSPTVLTAMEVQGDFDSLSPVGFVALGASGFVVNALLCGLGWWGVARKGVTAEFRLTAWFFFAVNGMLLTTKTMLEPLLGWGDWMTILRPLPATTLLRTLFAMLGTAGVILMVRRSGAGLARLVFSGESQQRVTEARRIVLVGAAAAAVLAFGGGVTNPVGAMRGSLLGLGAGVGPFVPLLFGTRFAARTSSRNADRPSSHGGLWLLAAGAITAIMWFAFGPGIYM